MTPFLASLFLGAAAALVALDLGKARRAWRFGAATLESERIDLLSGPLAALTWAVQKRMNASSDLLSWEEIAFSLACHLRAGETVAQALTAVSLEDGDRPHQALRRVCQEYEAGVPILQALSGRRTADHELDNLASVLEMGINNGGDVPTLLCRTAENFRRRRTRKKEARSRLAEARLTAVLLAVMPWGIGAFTFSRDARIAFVLTEDPQGRLFLRLALAMWATGVCVVSWLISSAVPKGRR